MNEESPNATNFNEDEEVFLDDDSTSSNSGTALVNSFFAELMNNHNETQLDSSFLNRSSLTDISVFPSEVRFPTSFPNIELKQKLLFSNRSMANEHFTIRMTGDPEFTVEEEELDLAAGSCYSLYVTFLPKVVSLYQASLILEGHVSLVVSLLGHCVPSPLDFPAPSSPLWSFPNSKTHRTFMFTNRSYSIPLEVNFSVNSQSITVDPSSIALDPGTSDHICITFDPKFNNLRVDPSITIDCPKSGDNVTIPLQFIGARSCIVVDFGIVAVGSFCTQRIQLKSPQIAPLSIKWPFAIIDADENGIEQNEFTFSFQSKRSGSYRQMLTFDSFDIELKANATEPPFSIKIPKKYPNQPLEFRNTADRTIRFKFQTPQGYILDTDELILRPNQAGKLNIISESGVAGSPEITITWTNTNGKQVTDRVELPKDGNFVIDQTEISLLDDKSQLNISEIRKSYAASQSMSVSKISPKRKTKRMKNNSQHAESLLVGRNSPVKANGSKSRSMQSSPSKVSPTKSQIPETINNDPAFQPSSKIIPFFGVSENNQQSFELAISAPKDFSVVVPDFVSLYDQTFTSNVPFILTCDSSPQNENADYLKVISDGQIVLQIPIFSYRDASNLEFDSTIIMNKSTAVLDVRNTGNRSGFITFALSNDSQVTVTPLARILDPFQAQQFIFNFQSDPEKAQIAAITGDEIIRQIKSMLRPNDFYSTAFRDQPIKAELSLIQDALSKCDRREIASITRKFVHQTPLRFVSNLQLTFSPALLEFNTLQASKRMTISNNGFQTIQYQIETLDNFVLVSRKSGEIPPESQIKITVSLQEAANSAIRIYCGDDKYEVPIDYIEVSSEKINNPTFSVSQPIIDFGQVEIGFTNESKLALTNHTSKDIVLTIQLPKRSPFNCQKIAPIKANSSTEVSIQFCPTLEEIVESSMKIESLSDRIEVDLIGEGIITKEIDNLSNESDSDCVLFPKCEPGILRRAKVKVSNRTTKKVIFNASVDPPFICPFELFQIDPRSYVWFPIHFLPKAYGIYEGTLEFRDKDGKTTIVMLKGTCE